MTLRHLRIFVEVCRTGSITKAAESLHLSQPAVSLAIRQLEEYYGILLFDRISKKLYLTESGNKMLSYASHIIESFDDMERSYQDTSFTKLSFRAIPALASNTEVQTSPLKSVDTTS